MASKEKITVTVEFVDEKDVPPETLARMHENEKDLALWLNRQCRKAWQKKRNGATPIHA